jgi:hypothetical protein
MTINDTIRGRINAFAVELEELIRAAAVQAVAQALGAGGSAAAPRSAVATVRTKPAPRPRATSGGKRDPKVLAATVEHAAEWIKAHPGQGVEAMAAGLKLPTKDLALPIIKLLDGKRIRKTGVKRATKYFPK